MFCVLCSLCVTSVVQFLVMAKCFSLALKFMLFRAYVRIDLTGKGFCYLCDFLFSVLDILAVDSSTHRTTIGAETLA